MNLVDLNVLASPVGGIVGGVAAAREIPGANQLLAGMAGLGVGAVLYAAVFGLGWSAWRVWEWSKKRKGQRGLDQRGMAMGVGVLLIMLILPFVSAGMAHWLVPLVFRAF